ncbi:uncharacterized protein LOC143075492 [Mytilus galloprovincialis]|uniref:uncharacterized protein LOC143075492 n=1 Tax=Mytilus galloprovincialis TaxID=29158 RepID=UPI003F7B82A2
MDEDDYDSDSTDESENNDTEHDSKSENISQKKTRKTDPRREVTYNVFEELLWPQMIGKTKLHKNRYHPLLIWTEIMSFIKGSFEALASKKDYLSKAEYFEMGRKQAPAFVGDRETLYELFLIYEHMRRQKCLFDQTDVVKNLYRRFMKQKRRKWIVHEIYVDEAQDFTQSELFLLINLCESPSGMFLTGDTAQSIMKGVSFRFKDLVSLFHYTSKNLTMNAVDVSTIPERVHSLPHNYRSHTGITDLAKSVLDILSDLFPDSFDKLPDEQCVFNGPKPVLLYAYSPDDLIKMLCHHKQETSQIEFGAHQAILVVDDDARDKVPEELKTGIVLTLYEAKGLEFDDILLFNIFKNSQASKEWRVVTDFLQRQGKDKTLQTGYSSRPLTFDPKLHKVLNSELKQLYTAITRARVNVWIFDEDVEKRTPMFQYFTALGLVKTSIEKNFTVKSTPAEWTASGEELMKRDLYEQAAQCFKMAGCIYKEELAYTYLHYKNARKKIQNSSEMREELYQATLKFLKLKRTKEAAKCLAMAKHYDLATEIYEKRQRFEKAAEMFRRSDKPSECCRIFEHISRFDRAIGVLQEFNMFDEAIASLRRYKEKKVLNQIRMKDSIREHFYIPQKKYGIPEAKCYHCSSVICGSLDSTSNLMTHMRRKHREVPLEILIQPDGSGLQNSYNRSDSSLHPLGNLYDEDQININAAGHYHKHHDINRMLEFLDHIRSVSVRIDFLTSRYNGNKEYITYAARILVNKDKTKEAIDLYNKYGFPEEALQFYDINRDAFSYSHCLVLSSLLHMKIKPDGSANAGEAIKVLEERLRKSIRMLLKCKEGNNKESIDGLTNTEGEANLLLGRLTGHQKYIELAFERFQVRQPLENNWGKMECLNWMMNISDLKQGSHLDLVVKWLQDTLALLYTITSENNSLEKIQLVEDYGIKQEGVKLFYNPRQHPPISRLFKTLKNKSVKKEVDRTEVLRVIIIDLLKKINDYYWKFLPIVEKNFTQALSVCQLKRTCTTFKYFEVLLESNVQKIRLDYFLHRIKELSDRVTKEENQILRHFKTRTGESMSCRNLIRETIQIVPRINNLSMKDCNCIRGQVLKVREEMNEYFKSHLSECEDEFNDKREKNISTLVEMITYHKLFGLSVDIT